MNTRPPCAICGMHSSFLMRKDGYDEYLCPSCGLSFVYPQPSPEWLKEEVYSYESGYQGNKRSDLGASRTDERTTKALDFLAKKKPGGSILDVGCSNGILMYWARARGMRPRGVEINKRTADMAAANGFAVHQGFIETCPFPKGGFDAVYMGDVIEHVNDPRAFVRTCASFLAPGGVMAISTPNVDCLWSRMTLFFYKAFGVPWSGATPPHHLFQFSERNLSKLLAESGFRPIRSIFTGPSSLKYELGSLHLLGAWKRERTLRSFAFMAFSYAAYAVAFAIANLLGPIMPRRFEMVIIYERAC